MSIADGQGFRRAGGWACVVVSVLVLGSVLFRTDLGELGRVFLQLKPAWAIGAGILFGCAYLFAAWRWHIVLRLSGRAVHFRATAQAVFSGHFFNTIFFGPAGGDIAKATVYARWYGFPLPSVLTTCFLDRLLGGAGFLTLVLCTPGLAAYGGNIRHSSTTGFTHRALWITFSILALLLAAGYFARRKFDYTKLLRDLSQNFLANLSQLAKAPRQALLGYLFAFLSQCCMSSMLLLCLQSVAQKPFSSIQLLWTFPVISLISSAPLTFAGAGLREGAALVLLGMYGISSSDAVAASLLVLVFYLLWAGIAALILWLGQRAQQNALPWRIPQTISAIIPALNEAQALPETIQKARQVPEIAEIIVVDGGSSDQTKSIAEQMGCRVVDAPRGRGGQMRMGASQASGDVILLLHADTWLPSQAGKALLTCLRDRTVVGGGFWKAFRNPSPLMLGQALRCAVRLWAGRRIAGDQAMFVRRDALEKIGGVPNVPLMEEFELCRQLNRIGRLALAPATVSTSARRFAKLGVLRTYARMWHVMIRYYLGTPVHELKQLYEKD